MSALEKSVNNEGGFTYLMVMFFVVMIGISLMMIGQQWSVTMKRDREAELLFRGTRIKDAIERYGADFESQNLKGTRAHRYPQKLKDLTQKPKRYLQAIYKDPMTGKDFELIKTGTEIRGVRSTSQDKPYDQVNFKDAKTYHAVRFEVTGQTGDCTTGVDISSLENKVASLAGCSGAKTTAIDPKTGKPFEQPTDTDNFPPDIEEDP